MAEQFLITREKSTRCIQVNRQEKKNALTAEMYAGLSEAIRTADAGGKVNEPYRASADG